MPELKDGRINILVDPSRPDAWQREPYYRALKEWARLALAQRRQLVLSVRQRSIVVLPDRDVDLGIVKPDEVITVVEVPGLGGRATHDVYAVDGNSPMGKEIAAAKGGAVPLRGEGGEGFRKGRTLA